MGRRCTSCGGLQDASGACVPVKTPRLTILSGEECRRVVLPRLGYFPDSSWVSRYRLSADEKTIRGNPVARYLEAIGKRRRKRNAGSDLWSCGCEVFTRTWNPCERHRRVAEYEPKVERVKAAKPRA